MKKLVLLVLLLGACGEDSDTPDPVAVNYRVVSDSHFDVIYTRSDGTTSRSAEGFRWEETVKRLPGQPVTVSAACEPDAGKRCRLHVTISQGETVLADEDKTSQTATSLIVEVTAAAK